MPNKITNFWKWFEDNNHAFLFTNEVDEDIKEQLLNDFLEQLHVYNDKLYFQIELKILLNSIPSFSSSFPLTF